MSTERVDLRLAEHGDDLLQRNGRTCRYCHHDGDYHIVSDFYRPNRVDDGRANSANQHMLSDYDIVRNYSQEKRMSKPRPSFVLFGGAAVGNQPIPVPADPYVHLRQALREGKQVQWRHAHDTDWPGDVICSDPADIDREIFHRDFIYRIKPEPEPVAAVGGGRIEWPSDTFVWNQGRDFRLGWDCAIERCKAAVERAKL